MPNPTEEPTSILLPEPPPVPHYDATLQEVEIFLRDYFKSQLGLSDTQSLEMAQKFPFHGPALFQASEEKLRDTFSFIGGPLFYHIQDSRYGRVCSIPYLICCFLTSIA